MPETADNLSRRLDILIELGPAFIMVHSAAAPEVEETYRRALALVERLGDDSRRFPVLWGLWFVLYTRGSYRPALTAAEELLSMARAGDDTGKLVEAHHAAWPTLLAMGRTAASVPYMERGIALYERDRHAGQASLYAGHDPGACCRYQLGAARWLLGFPDGALASARDAVRLAEELKHPMTVTTTLWFMAWVQYQRGEHEAAAESTKRQLALAQAHGFEHWTDSAGVIPLGAPTAARPSGQALDDAYRRPGVASSAWRSSRTSRSTWATPRARARSSGRCARRTERPSARRRSTASRATSSYSKAPRWRASGGSTTPSTWRASAARSPSSFGRR
jgi:tetratricopeptide (TPR) repeat protein